MNVYQLTASDIETLRELFADTHNIDNARALDVFMKSLLSDGFTHHTAMPSLFSVGTPVEVVTGYEAILN